APSHIGNKIEMQDGDALLFINFRADRAREIARVFVDKDFDGFDRGRVPSLHFVQTTEYASDIDAPVAFPPFDLKNSFGDYLSQLGKTQLRIAETEKYAHVTFFFSGGQEEPYKGENRILIPSPKVATYDLKPEMSVYEVTEKLCEAIRSNEYDAIICNFANGDMVGHTGIFEAAVKAVEAVDSCLEKIMEAINEVDGQCLITADHGNCERMVDTQSGQPLTSHTTEPVPFIYVGNKSI
ncbi:MAG: 2,3-bisphosphoglycerate-independent phosphoglycerate mutase, partial [Pseudomonadales bacterium]